MAIQYSGVSFLSRRNGTGTTGNSLSAAAYGMRTQLYDERLGQKTDRWVDDGTLAHHEILLPSGADPRFEDPQVLWNAVEAAEKRIDAQVGQVVINPLPLEKTREENIELARAYAIDQWVSKGHGVQLDIHDVPGNPHAHNIVTPRKIEGGRMARLKTSVDAVFTKIGGRPILKSAPKWGAIWATFQEEFFRLRGSPITVDPIAPVPGKHIGLPYSRNPKLAENAKRQEMNATLARDPQSVAQHLGKHQRFDGRTLERFVARHVKDPVERQIIQAEALPKLAALQRAALIKASQADMTASGLRRLSVEDVAREISPPYAKVLTKTAALRDEARDVDRAIRQATASVTAGESRTEQRRQTISLSRKLLHSTGIYTDPEIDRGLVQQKRGAGWRAKLRIKEKRIEHQLAALFTQATDELEKVRPEAQRELETRQRIARNARAQLQVVEKSDRTLRVRRTPTLRP